MDAHKIRLARRRRFAEVLGRYRDQHSLSLQQLAALFGKPRSTVQHWLSGTRMPPATDLKRLCARINVNYDVMFAEHAVRDVFFETQVIGMSALQHRYLEAKQEDPLNALGYLPMSGALMFNRLVRAGIECRLLAKADYTVWIQFQEPALKTLTVIIQARGMDGIGFSVIQEDNSVRHPWIPVTPQNVDSLIDVLTATTQS